MQLLLQPCRLRAGRARGPPLPIQETTHEVPRSPRRQGQNHSRHRRLGEDVSVPVPVRHRRPGAQRLREGHLLVLRRPALPGAAVSLRHHLGRGLVPGAVAVQQPDLHGAAGARRRPPHHQRLRLHLAGAGEGRRRDRRAGAALHGARRLLLQELGRARGQVEGEDGSHHPRARGGEDSAPGGHGRDVGGDRRPGRIRGLPPAQELRRPDQPGHQVLAVPLRVPEPGLCRLRVLPRFRAEAVPQHPGAARDADDLGHRRDHVPARRGAEEAGAPRHRAAGRQGHHASARNGRWSRRRSRSCPTA